MVPSTRLIITCGEIIIKITFIGIRHASAKTGQEWLIYSPLPNFLILKLVDENNIQAKSAPSGLRSCPRPVPDLSRHDLGETLEKSKNSNILALN